MRAEGAVVIGAGPAGWAAAAALHAAGVPTTVVAPDPDLPWPQTFGVWRDELEAAGLADTAARTWEDTWVHAADRQMLGRGYCRIDNARLRSRLAPDGIARVSATVTGLVPGPHRVAVETSAGPFAARVVVDARGAAASVAHAWQSAYGVEIEWPNAPFPADAMGLMDLRDAPGLGPHDLPPSFLYVMPMGGGRWFVEETALATRAPVPFAVLEDRLGARLRAADGPDRPDGPVERCRVPLWISAPAAPNGVVAFGAAAGMVHPATGYHLGHALRAARPFAAAIAGALDRGPAIAARAGEGIVRSAARRATARLHRLGLTTLLRLDSADIRTFFHAFFALPPESWRAWLDPASPPTAVAGAMWRLFAGATPEVRRLVSRGMVPTVLYAGGGA